MHTEEAQIEWVSKTPLSLNEGDQEQEDKVLKLMEALQDLDDVRDVYTNLS